MNVLVVKVGGGAGVDGEAVCRDVAQLVASGQPVVLVHGASAATDALAARTGLPSRQLVSPSGHVSRYTDPETLEIYVAAAAGQVNKTLVARLQSLGCNAAGLSGVDGGLLVAQRKGAVRTVENGRQRVVRDDYTGQLQSANGGLLRLLLEAGYTPVVAPVALGTEGERLNVDGDRAAAQIAAALAAPALVILSNVPGLLAAYPDERSLVRHVPATGLDAAEAPGAGPDEKEDPGCPRSPGRRRAASHPGRFSPSAAHPGRLDRRGHGGRRAAPGSRLPPILADPQQPGIRRRTPTLMDQQTIIDLEGTHTSGVYPKRPLAIVRGQGHASGMQTVDLMSTASADRGPPTWATRIPGSWRPSAGRPGA